MEALHGNWTLYLDTYTVSAGNTHVTYTRMRAQPIEPLRGAVQNLPEGFLFGDGKSPGGQDLETGYEEFDARPSSSKGNRKRWSDASFQTRRCAGC